MAGSTIYETTLRLSTLDDLFEAPKLSPFSTDYGLHSGGPALDFIADEIYANSSYRQVRTVFEVPATELERVGDADLGAAIERWADTKRHAIEHDIDATNWRGIRWLAVGLIAFVVLIASSRMTGQLDGGVADTLSRGLEVGAWVVLWFPLDTLVFSGWQFRLDRRAYRLIREMQVTVRPIPDR